MWIRMLSTSWRCDLHLLNRNSFAEILENKNLENVHLHQIIVEFA